MSGDNYTNSGINYGIMGPVSFGKQEFILTQGHIAHIVAVVPKDKPVEVWAVGAQQAFPMQAKISAALRSAGLQVTTQDAATIAPPPEVPLSVDSSGPVTRVVIAPTA